MKTNFRNEKLHFAMVLILTAFLALSGCADSSSSDDDPEISEIAATFTAANGEKIQQSVIDLPASLVASSESQQESTRVARSLSGDGDGSGDDNGMEGIYSGIPHYVRLAEDMKNVAEDIIFEIMSSAQLKTATLGEEIMFPEDPEDSEAPRKAIVEKTPEETYKWKVSLFFEEDDQTPDAIVRFTLEGPGAKGRILWGMTEQDERLQDVSIDVSIDRRVDIVFDGTVSPQTLEVKVVQDLTDLRSRAESSWDVLNDDQKEAMDLGQPDKVFVSTEYDGAEFTIYGTSYNPGWRTKAELEDEDYMLGDPERTMYMFKAKAVDGAVEGAKLYLALPKETRSTIDDLWAEDSVGNIITDMMLDKFNEMIAKLTDESDDGGEYENLSIFKEKQMAVYVMCWILGDGVCVSMDSHDATFSTSEHAEFQAYYSQEEADDNDYRWLMDMTEDSVSGITPEGLNALYSGLSGDTKKYAYNVIMLPTFKFELDNTNDGYVVTKDQLEDFIFSDATDDYADASGDSEKADMQDGYSAVKYMINPAFYSEEGGFLGTYDDSKSTYYRFANGTLTATTDTNPINGLLDLDLSSIAPYAPTDVISAEIAVE